MSQFYSNWEAKALEETVIASPIHITYLEKVQAVTQSEKQIQKVL